ncbi:MAG: tetratricopeptide repeat protein [Gemmatimonadota bacterium]|nr:tetratricopeptide repeat protein [Gemmatimonadota bacterium]
MLPVAAIGLCVLFACSAPVWGQAAEGENESFELAQRLFDNRDYANAAQEFRRFIAGYPASARLPSALYQLGEAHSLGEQYREAVEAYGDFLVRYPERLEAAPVMRRKAEALEHLSEYAMAGAAFQEAYDRFPAAKQAAGNLLAAGMNFGKAEDPDAAGRAFGALVANFPQSRLAAEANYNWGLVLLDAGRPDEALDRFRTITAPGPDSDRIPDALLEIGRIALGMKDAKEAEAAFGRLRRAYPRSSAAGASYLAQAGWYEGRGNWSRAAEIYGLARGSLPQSDGRQQAVLGLANAWRELGRTAEALALFTEFINVYAGSPHLDRAWLGLGRAHAGLIQHREAQNAFRRLRELYPESEAGIQAYAEMGDVWRAAGAPRRALRAYRAYIEETDAPGAGASARLRMAHTYEQDLGWHDLALETYRDLAETAPAAVAGEAQFGIARILDRTGQADPAIREYRTYLQRYHRRAGEAQDRIRYLREFGRDSGSVPPAELAALLSSFPAIANDPQAQLVLGRFLHGQRQYEDAAEILTAALSADLPPALSAEAAWLLGMSALRMARKAGLEGRPDAAAAWRQKGKAALDAVEAEHPESEYADDAALLRIETETRLAEEPDSVGARRHLAAYGEFTETYPNSGLLDRALLAMADAMRTLGGFEPAWIDTALTTYRGIRNAYPQSPAAERATYGIGLCLALKKDYVPAEETLRDFLFEFPESDLESHARYQLGRILLERGFPRSAADDLNELLAGAAPAGLARSARDLLAESYYRAGDYPRAIDVDAGLLSAGPEGPVLRRLARSYEANGQAAQAIETCKALLDAFPNAAYADSFAYTRARLLAKLERNSEAVTAFKAFPKQYPESQLNAEAGKILAALLFETEDYRGALAALAQVPADARDESVAGREVLSLFRLKRVQEAKKASGGFKKTYPNSRDWLARFRIEEGGYYLGAGNFKKARQIFEDVVKNHPGGAAAAAAEAAWYRVKTLKREGQKDAYREALAAFVKARSGSRYWPAAALELADILFDSGDYERASRAYRNVLEAGPSPDETPKVLSRLMKVHRRLKLLDTAIAYASRLVQEFPGHPLASDVRIDVGTMLLDNKQYRLAIARLTPLLRTTEGNDWSAIQYTIAKSYFGLADYDSAIREYLKLQYQFQGEPQWRANANYGLADCYEARGNFQEAIRELKAIQRREGAASDLGLQAGERIELLKALIDSGRESAAPAE